MMGPGVRKAALASHVVTSVGWLGAVGAFLALAIAGLTSRDLQLVRGVYLCLELVTRYVIVPLSIASFVTGIIQSLGTNWGLLRYWWVIAKLVLVIPATALLFLHTQPIYHLGSVAATAGFAADDLVELRGQLVFDAAAALVVLLVVTLLSVYKPRGVTGYGKRKLSEPRLLAEAPARGEPLGGVYASEV
jgi:hypothetical protein